MTYTNRFQGAPRTFELVGANGGKAPKWLENHAIQLEKDLLEACVIIRQFIRKEEALYIARQFIKKMP